ncbi:hypothetical protein AAFC00_005756 [Neodothiora populina]|uniref:DNA-(apurinic or apyrimidinic site) endonuclease 2 n=1 Tax=Neodothiora populina TaxID=2781224 RepID=A0ABR3P5R5_9PEZI
MRLTTWNVNGIRNPFGYQPWNSARTFPAMFDILEADIVVMQELKIQRKDLRDDMVLIDGWDCYFSLPKHKKGYSGVGIYTRNATCSPIRAEEGILGVLTPPNSTLSYRELPESQHIGGYPSELQIVEWGVDPAALDSEGRCVCLEFPAFVLFGVYSPANSNGLRDDFRYGFLCALECRIRNLIKLGKRVVLVGDLNVSRSEIDTAGAAEELRKNGMTHEQYISTPNRRVFNQLIVGGEVFGERDEGRETPVLMDVVRDCHPDRRGMYTHWEQKVNARPGNFGSRIDFILASTQMDGWFSAADIQEGLMGSDHCPVYGDFRATVPLRKPDDTEEDVNLLDIMSPVGVFESGERQNPWIVKEVPPFSAKLMPEFYQRRSIKDMFKKPTAPSSTSSASSTPMSKSLCSIEPANADLLASASETSEGPSSSLSTVSSTPKAVVSSPDRKRKPTETSAPRPLKKQKSFTSLPTKPTTGKNQASMKSFFQPSSSTKKPGASPKKEQTTAHTNIEVDSTYSNHNGDDPLTGPIDASSDTTTASPVLPDPVMPHNTGPSTHPPNPQDQEPPQSDILVHDPIVSKESWQSLFQRKKSRPPLCEGHSEPCKSMLTKKKGENQGRSFWMCTRPLGPSGQKEKGSQWRCGTFIWCSDWRGGINFLSFPFLAFSVSLKKPDAW